MTDHYRTSDKSYLLTLMQLSLRIRNRYHIVKVDLVRHPLNDLAEKLDVSSLPENNGMDDER